MTPPDRPDPVARPGPVSPPRVAAVVLAGGRARRFGSDKLAAPLGGRTVLAAAVASAAAVADEVIVAIGPDSPEPPLPVDLPVPVRLVRDAEAGGGPLAALPAALGATEAPVALVVAGDTPRLPPGVARLLLDALAGPAPAPPGEAAGRDPSPGPVLAAALLDGGELRPLPIAFRRVEAAREAARLAATGERRLRALAASLGAVAVPEDAWRTVDPAGDALRDIDTPEDLATLG